MKVLAEESWSWMLLEHDGDLIMSVVCGSVGLYTIEFVLSNDEQSAYQQLGLPHLNQMARSVSWQPESFLHRQLKGFSELPDLKEAVANWRAQHAVAP